MRVAPRPAPTKIALLTSILLLILLGWSSPGTSQEKIPLYYYYKVGGASPPYTSNNTHPLLDGAIIRPKWSQLEPTNRQFDWSVIEQQLADWTAGGKTVLLKPGPYSQTPLEGDPNGDNDETPKWVYDAGVPRLSFAGGGVAAGDTVSVPKVWDPAFYDLYEGYLRALSKQFGKDPRVAGWVIGVGHNGNLVAQPSESGAVAFLDAGWTPEAWEAHVKRILKMAVKFFKTKPIYLQFTPVLLRDYAVSDNLTTAQNIAAFAAVRSVSIIFSGLDEDVTTFNETGYPQIVAYLATVNTGAGFTIGFTDDWPLWVPEERSTDCPSPTCGRDVIGFATALQEAVDVWASVGGEFPMFYVFNESETSATNVDNGNFQQDVYDIAVQYLFPVP